MPPCCPDIAADQPVDEAAVQDLYTTRLADYVVPEKRLVERLVYPDDAAAAAAKARLDAGESFETLVAERGLDLTDIDLGDVTKSELGAAGDAVFALTGPGVAGPLPSDLGPALFRMNAILAAQETTLDEAQTPLRWSCRPPPPSPPSPPSRPPSTTPRRWRHAGGHRPQTSA